MTCNIGQCLAQVEIPAECGRSNVTLTRIVNGTPARKGAWPWQVAIGYRNPNDDTIDYLCGGTLVTTRHVVTAAHCLRDDLETVLLGEHIIEDDNDGAAPEEYKVTSSINCSYEMSSPHSYRSLRRHLMKITMVEHLKMTLLS